MGLFFGSWVGEQTLRTENQWCITHNTQVGLVFWTKVYTWARHAFSLFFFCWSHAFVFWFFGGRPNSLNRSSMVHHSYHSGWSCFLDKSLQMSLLQQRIWFCFFEGKLAISPFFKLWLLGKTWFWNPLPPLRLKPCACVCTIIMALVKVQGRSYFDEKKPSFQSLTPN